MAKLFEGRTALITGAAGGIGGGGAQRLASQGANVALADISLDGAEVTAANIRKEGGSAQAYRLDVTSADDVRGVVVQIEKQFGLVTLAVTCAGIIRTYTFLDLPPDVWDLTLDINLKGTFLTFQAVARRLVEAGHGGHTGGTSAGAVRRGGH